MERVNLSSNLSVSPLIVGLWQIADMEKGGEILDAETTAEKLLPYVEAGFTTFDMADHYGSAELIAGAFRSTHNHPVECLTKWVPTPGKLTKAEVRNAVEKALKRLRTDTLDLLQYHAWNYADPSYLDQLNYLQELKEEGLISNIGVTNFDAAHLKIAVDSGINLVSNQISYSLLDQRAAGEMTDICLENNISILAYGTLGGGFLSKKWLNQPEPDIDGLGNWSLMKYKRFINEAGGWDKFQELLSLLDGVAKRNNCSISMIASRYIKDLPAVASVIVGARLGQSSYLEDQTKMKELNISDTDLKEVASLLDTMRPIPGNCGDEYRKPPFLTASGDLSHHIEELPPPFETRIKGKSTIVLSGTTWETEFGYSRAIKTGNTIKVSGTTASHGDQVIGANNAYVQTHFIIDKIEGALQSLGSSIEQVVRTRIYISNMDHSVVVAKVHGQRFGSIQPANTLVKAELVGDPYLVEIEAEAITDA